MLPFAELKRRKESLFEQYGEDGCIFVRPSSGFKTFTGKVIEQNIFEKEYESLGLYDVAPHATVVVSTPKNVKQEWRLIIVDMRVIAGSLYNDRTTNLDYKGYPEDVAEYAKNVLKTEYQPDRAWTLDICRTSDGELHLLEIGGFSCAGMYSAEIQPIVREVSRVAWEIHCDNQSAS